MSGLFGGGSRGPTQEEKEAQKRQDELTAKQEERTARQEAEEQRRIAAQLSARRTGGTRSLLSPEREDARKGLTTKLGA